MALVVVVGKCSYLKFEFVHLPSIICTAQLTGKFCDSKHFTAYVCMYVFEN